jgi:hypothetical protein
MMTKPEEFVAEVDTGCQSTKKYILENGTLYPQTKNTNNTKVTKLPKTPK